MKFNILGITLVVILGVPAIALGSSFTYSVVQGQSPSEAFVTIGNQINSLFGRVASIEAEQKVINDRLDALEEDDLIPVVHATQTAAEAHSQICGDMKDDLASINDSLQKKKALLKQVKSMTREDVIEDDIQNQLKETAVEKNSLEGNIAQLEIKQKELVVQIKQESCI